MGTEKITTVNTRHDIGLVASARLIAILWAGTLPVVIPGWIIIKAQMVDMNIQQDQAIASHYISRSEFEDRMKLLDERAQRNTETLREIKDELKLQRETLEQLAALEKLRQRGRR